MKPNCFFLRLDRSNFKNGYYKIPKVSIANIWESTLLFKRFNWVLNIFWCSSLTSYSPKGLTVPTEVVSATNCLTASFDGALGSASLNDLWESRLTVFCSQPFPVQVLRGLWLTAFCGQLPTVCEEQ